MTTIGFRAEAGEQTGYGHAIRCLALANELKDRGCQCVFSGNRAVEEMADNHGFDLWHVKRKYRTDVFIVDLEGGTPPALARQLKQRCEKLVILNGVGYPDGDPGRLFADLVFYQGVSRSPYELDWTEFTGEWYEGPEWLILRKEFQGHSPRISFHDPLRVVVAGGGSDPKDITSRAVDALSTQSVDVLAILGPAHLGFLPNLEYANRHDEFSMESLRNPPSMTEALAWGDIAIVSYGMTAFECLALGLPTIALSISPDHATSAELVQERSGGALESLGLVEDVSDASILAAIHGQMMNYSKCSQRAREFVDGLGAARVADRIMEQINK